MEAFKSNMMVDEGKKMDDSVCVRWCELSEIKVMMNDHYCTTCGLKIIDSMKKKCF